MVTNLLNRIWNIWLIMKGNIQNYLNRAIYQEKLQKSESLLKGYKELFEKEKNKVFLLTQLTED